MKILTIQAAYCPMIGGAEVFHQKTAEWLVKKGHQVDVVTCIWDKPDIAWKHWQKKKEKVNGVNVYRVKPWFYTQYLKSFGAIWPLYKRALQLIKEKDYNLVHVHIFPALIVGAMLKKKTGLPLIATIQGGDVADYSETGSRLGWFLKQIIAWSLKKADIVHTVSTHMERSVKRLGVKSTKVIPNGVDTSLFKPRCKKKLRATYKIPRTKYVIISHSRLTPKNGLDILIKAVARLKNKQGLLVLLVGGGEQEADLKTLVRKLRLGKTIKFLGYKDRQTTAKLLSASDLFVRPSRQEGFGIAFLEAMASGLPVVGTKVGGIPEVVANEREGILVHPNTSSVAKSIERLRKASVRKRFGDKGREKAQKLFSWEIISSRLLQTYQKLLRG